MPRLAGMAAVPGVGVADAEIVERLQAAEEADAGRLAHGVVGRRRGWRGLGRGDELLDLARRGDGLQLALALELPLPRRQVVDK